MSKTAEWDAAVAQLRQCGESLIDTSETLRELFSDTELESESAPKPFEKTLTLEDVRAVLAEKSVQGHTAKVQALIHKHGAERLSQMDPDEYAGLLVEAEAL
jgi:hypothetical protein